MLRNRFISIAAVVSLEKADAEMFLLYYKNEKTALENYKEMFSVLTETDELRRRLKSMLNEASQLFRNHVSQSMAIAVTTNMKREGEHVKDAIRKVLDDEKYTPYYSLEERNILQSFINDNRKYFFNTGFDSEAIQLYMDALILQTRIIADRSFQLKKKVLQDQIRVIENPQAN